LSGACTEHAVETAEQLMKEGRWTEETATVLFIRLIIRLFQLIFSAATIFFSHNKSANSVFQPAYQHSRTAPTTERSYLLGDVASQQENQLAGISYLVIEDRR
jgi:hypothetical protein